MGEKAQRIFDFKRNLIQSELLFGREKMRDFKTSFIYGDVLYSKDDLKVERDIKKMIEFSDEFPNIICEADDKKGIFCIISITKSIPRSFKNKLVYIPKNTVCVTFMQVSDIASEDIITTSFLMTIDKLNRFVAVSEDNRLLKKGYKKERKIPSDIMDVMINNIDVYFSVYEAFHRSEYVLSYEYSNNEILYPLLGEDIKNLFKNRDKVGERRSPLTYGVREYKNKRGISYMSHMRGESEFVFEGRKVTLITGVPKWSNYEKESKLVKEYNEKRKEEDVV